MKLTTRLILVVTIILSVSTFASGFYSAYLNRQNQVDDYIQLLNNTTKQITTSSEDPISFALLLAEQSPIPMTLIYISDEQKISYLAENAGTDFKLPDASKIFKAKQAPKVEIGNIHIYLPLSDSESLGFYLSTKKIEDIYKKSLRTTLLFNLGLVFISSLLIALFFRRDSRLNSLAIRMREFIGDASHELKSPLTVIRGYSELLLSSKEPPKDYAQRINDESIRMAKIIDQMLALSALEEENLGEAEDIELSELISKKVADLKLLQPERSVDLELSPVQINAPYQLVDVLVTNILDNARIHTPTSAPIKVTLKNQRLVIEDGGPGLKVIPDKPFERFDSSRSRLTGGSGLGMSLIQKCASAIQAKLHFGKSELGGLKIELHF